MLVFLRAWMGLSLTICALLSLIYKRIHLQSSSITIDRSKAVLGAVARFAFAAIYVSTKFEDRERGSPYGSTNWNDSIFTTLD